MYFKQYNTTTIVKMGGLVGALYRKNKFHIHTFLMDNFDGDVHARMLPRLGQNHSHLIPVEDYARLERAVAAALREAVGSADAGVLEQQLLTRFAAPLDMPRSQAMLLALRETLPLVADTVLQRSRNLYGATGQSAQ